MPGHTILQVDISFKCTKSSYSQTYPQNQRHLLNSPTPSPLPIPLILISDWWVTNVNTFWPLNNRIRTKGIKNEIDWLINQSVWDDEIPKEDIPVAFPGAAATDDWLVWLGARPHHQPLILPLKLTYLQRQIKKTTKSKTKTKLNTKTNTGVARSSTTAPTSPTSPQTYLHTSLMY